MEKKKRQRKRPDWKMNIINEAPDLLYAEIGSSGLEKDGWLLACNPTTWDNA